MAAVAGGKAVFSVYESDPNDPSGWNSNQIELWLSDDTTDGTVKIRTLSAATNTPETEMVSHRGFAYFTARDNQYGDELWRTDGSADGASKVKELVPGLDYHSFRNLTSAENRLFFTYHRGGTV